MCCGCHLPSELDIYQQGTLNDMLCPATGCSDSTEADVASYRPGVGGIRQLRRIRCVPRARLAEPGVVGVEAVRKAHGVGDHAAQPHVVRQRHLHQENATQRD